ncbi:MAG: hypothetical protein HUU50_17570 [Candidatus Brocadiae bacterium]|nr:hypothetical protein [Candidatus Brocadiia bacterium]
MQFFERNLPISWARRGWKTWIFQVLNEYLNIHLECFGCYFCSNPLQESGLENLDFECFAFAFFPFISIQNIQNECFECISLKKNSNIMSKKGLENLDFPSFE